VLTIDYRPRRFSEIVGQREPISVMRAVADQPDTAPRVYLFQGGRGLGKTTLSRVFSRVLLCANPAGGDACLVCEACVGFTDIGTHYQEYDATQVGNVKFMRDLSDHLRFTAVEGFRVVVLDEIQSASIQAMSALLKLLEEGPKNTFFLLCTTDPDKLLQTIRSRSVELSFSPVSDTEVRSLLVRIAQGEKMDLPQAVLDSIVSFSFGYAREAVMRLDVYLKVQDPDKFLGMMYIPEKDIIQMFLAFKRGDQAIFEESLSRLSAYPMAHLRKSFEVFTLNAMKALVDNKEASVAYVPIVEAYGIQLYQVLTVLSQGWVVNCFQSDTMFQAFTWFLYSQFSKEQTASASKEDDRFKKG